MALEPAPEFVQAHIDFAAAIQRHDLDALGEMISTHPAMTATGTQPGAVARGRETLLAALAGGTDDGGSLVDTHVEAFADGDLGYVCADAVWTSPDGITFPVRGLRAVRRRDIALRHYLARYVSSAQSGAPFSFQDRYPRA